MLVCVLVKMLVTLACLLSWLTSFVEARENSCSGGTEGLRCRHPTLDLGFGVFLLPESTGHSDVFGTFWHLHALSPNPEMTCEQSNTEIGWGTTHFKFKVENAFGSDSVDGITAY